MHPPVSHKHQPVNTNRIISSIKEKKKEREEVCKALRCCRQIFYVANWSLECSPF
jgi:hypothetical protein